MQDQRIDCTPDIIDRRIADDPHATRLGIDLDLTDLRAVGEAPDQYRLVGNAGQSAMHAAMAMGLVKGDAVDASVMEANASRYHGRAPDELDWTDKQRQARAMGEYLAALDETAEPNPDRKAPKVVSPSDPLSAWTDFGGCRRDDLK